MQAMADRFGLVRGASLRSAALLPIVYIHLGPRVAPHLIDSIRQSQREAPTTPIYVVLSEDSTMADMVDRCGAEVVRTSSLPRTEEHLLFERSVNRNAGRKQGFWVYTTERFFYLEEAMRLLGLERALHLESDNLIFFDPAEYEDRLAGLYPGLATPFLNDESCIPGVVYVGSQSALADLTSFIAERVAAARRRRWYFPLRLARVRMGGAPLNDMNLLAAFRDQVGSSSFAVLPMMPPEYDSVLKANPAVDVPKSLEYSAAFEELRLVFDAAAIGQYLNGVDQTFHKAAPNDSFVNTKSVLNPSDFTFRFTNGSDGHVTATMTWLGKSYRIASIHNHAKVDFLARHTSRAE